MIKLLQPKFYPRGRFPSEPTKALSLMQQVVVNIAINEDFQNLDIKSVNGPPGTGKTTLLKEVFAELAVRQSFEMARSLQAKKTQQSEFYKSGQIGVLDEAIAKYGILVASSNNSAVNNIVEEFPKLDSIANIFKDLLINANYFADISKSNNQKDTSNSKNWGLFSYKAGKYENIQELLDLVNQVVKSLEDEKIDENEEVNVINDFLNSYSKITDLINEKQKVYEIRSTFTKSELDRIEKNDYNFFNTQIEFKQEKDDLLASVKFYEKKLTKHKSKWNLFLKLFSKKRKKVFQENEKNVEKWKDKIKESQLIISNIDKGINKILKIEHLVNELLQKSNKPLPKLMENYLDLSLDYEKLNLHTPWFDDEFRKKQTELFIKSLKVRKIFIDKNKKSISNAVKILSEKNESDQNCLITAWKWINLVIPVISTTFASLGNSMFRKITIPFIPNLFIDEAGQATPWSGVGAFFRAKKIMVIGDPSQIEPVVSLNEEIQKQVSDYFQLSNSDYLNYISAKSSIQTLADNISKYGHYYQDWSIEKWVGIPLVVHRRCTSPIFDIFNKISYNERMIQTIKEPGTAEWINVVDASQNKNDYFVEKDFNITKEKIRQLIINDKTIETDDIFIITPFTEIRDKILEKLGNEAKEDIISEIEIMRKISKIMRKNTGTIHTFQGREAKIVFLILGHIEKTKTFDWAMGNDNPNIINVAVSRAKEQLYVIGNKNLFCRKNTDDKNKNTINHCSNVVRVLIEKTSNVEWVDDKNKNY
ncbi:DEAD/DEAH box helicase [Mesomycoplasma dispar]|uniref:DNA helicase n=1 Tax=Mesomycoplasma dispar TaxID=86660 RepID=A0ABM6PRP2_9BACT|nr:ATP-binding protein [Mesomycoplasma dispar]ATP59725.1 hypothetical protein CSW10_02140 [Mesomycoplasma dispar]